MPKAPSATRKQAKVREKGPKTVIQGFSTGSKRQGERPRTLFYPQKLLFSVIKKNES
jgi:hypothetical protein